MGFVELGFVFVIKTQGSLYVFVVSLFFFGGNYRKFDRSPNVFPLGRLYYIIHIIIIILSYTFPRDIFVLCFVL